MGENDVNIKLLIEAEDRSRAALDQARANTRSLVDQQKSLWKQVHEADEAEVSGNKEKALSAERYFEVRKKAAGMSEEINKGYRREESALSQLTRDHDAHAKGVEKASQQKIKSTHGASDALSHYLKHFVSIAAAEEVIRRSISEYAEWERGMARIEIQTGKNSGELEHFGHTIDGLARLTGISVGDLQKHFMTFQAGIGEMNHDVEKAFTDVVRASHAGGVSVDVMARTAVAALKTMQVPYSELRGMLDQVVKVIPASAMSAWDAAGPKILGVMRSIGHSGSESVGQAALAFSQLTQSLGSSVAAGNVQLEMLKKGTDQSSFFGKVMTPQLIELQKTQAGATKTGEAYYQQMEKLGIFDKEDPGRALFMQQKYGFSDEMVRGVEDYHKLYMQIDEEVKKSGKPWSDVERAITRLNQGPKAAIDQLTGSLGELLVSLGKFLGPSIPTTLTQYVNALNDGINRLDAGFAKLREATGSRKPAEKDEHGNVIKPAQETPWVFDPAGWIVSALGGGSLAEQKKHAETAPGFSFGKAGFGLEDALFQFLLGEDDPAHKRRQLELQEKREREGPQEPAPWGRTRVSPSPTPQPSQTPAHRPVGPGHGAARPDSAPRPGYAIGGEFEVQGGGGRDSQPVSFMATPGERIAVTTPMQESLQQQQDKADIAAREHFARFHGTAFTKTTKASWWGDGARQAGPGPGGAVPGMAGGGRTASLDPSSGIPRTSPPGTRPSTQSPDTGGVAGVPDLIGTGAPGEGEHKLRTDSRGVHPQLYEVVKEASKSLPEGYYAKIESGKEHRHRGGEHPKGNAADVRIYGPDGKPVGGSTGWYQNAKTFRMYEQFAQNAKAAELKLFPGSNQFQWGGYFTNGYSGKGPMPYGTADSMHMQWGGPAAGGNWQTGATGPIKEWLEREGGTSSGMGVAMKGPGQLVVNTEKTPEGQPVAGAPPTASSPSAVSEAVANGTATKEQTYQEFRRLAAEAGSPNPDLTAALAMHESGAGVVKKSVYTSSGRTNPFGQTGTGPGGAIRGADGQPHKVYRNLKEAFEDHVKGTYGARGKKGWAEAYVEGNPQKTMENLRALGYNTVNPRWLASVMAAHEKYKNTPQLAVTKPPAAAGLPPDAPAPATPPPAAGAAARPSNVRVVEAAPTPARPGAPAGAVTVTDADNKPATAPTNVVASAPAAVPEKPPELPPPGRQWGGLVRAGQQYLVGESGPEKFMPNVPGNIVPGGMPGMPDIASMFSGGMPGGFDFSGALAQFRELASEISKPLQPSMEMPRAGPMRQRMSRRVEAQRERDVSRMTRHAAHSDIGMG